MHRQLRTWQPQGFSGRSCWGKRFSPEWNGGPRAQGPPAKARDGVRSRGAPPGAHDSEPLPGVAKPPPPEPGLLCGKGNRRWQQGVGAVTRHPPQHAWPGHPTESRGGGEAARLPGRTDRQGRADSRTHTAVAVPPASPASGQGRRCHTPGIKLLISTKHITDELINNNLIMMREAEPNCLSLTRGTRP